ncbi:MAG: tRNA (N(6)-L-threonylcarbamoyladenosine(37)-C(2))-methylthiotransferase MtaB, partial [Oscillospiraceae bacterium]|nr:tRNA (N(6)-L-threonylcarbamoyladenosine(37)-C(2))-methylthiotransferase MtaB [Oscillospiraceae bacterium]
MRFCTYTLGCKANQYDTQTIERLLCERGFEHVKLGDGADICIINTCAVTAESVRKSKQTVRRIKKNEPFSLIAVCGCFSELEPNVAKELDVDIIGGAKDRETFVEELLEKFQQSHAILNSTTGSITNTSINPISTTATTPTITTPSTTITTSPPTQRTRALLKIQDGCDNYCTYCIIPFARGESRSIPLEEL